MKRKMLEKIKKNQNVIIVLLVIVVVSFMTVGFALYGELLKFGGNVTLQPDGKIKITNVTLVNSANVVSSNPTFSETSLEFNTVFGKVDEDSDEFYAIYSVDIINESSYDYTYSKSSFVSTVNGSSGGTGELSLAVSGISSGDIIKPGETRTVTMRLDLTVSDSSQQYDTSGSSADLTLEQNEKGSILAAATPSNVDLSGDTESVELKLEVINTYKRDITFDLTSNNTNFIVVDASGNELTDLTLAASTTSEYTVYLKVAEGSVFVDEDEDTMLILKCDSIGNIYTDDIYITVDKSEVVNTDPPQIGPITFTINNTVGSADLEWSRLGTGATIKNYTILVYDESGEQVGEPIVTKQVNYTLTGLDEGNYYVKIYATDEAGLSGSGDVESNCTTTTTYCRSSETVSLKWTYKVTFNLTEHLSVNGLNTVNLGNTYGATVSTSSFFLLVTIFNYCCYGWYNIS